MEQGFRNLVISKFGDAAAGLLDLIGQAEALSVAVSPDSKEGRDFFDLILQIDNYARERGFELTLIVIHQEVGCTLRLAIRDAAPVTTLQ